MILVSDGSTTVLVGWERLRKKYKGWLLFVHQAKTETYIFPVHYVQKPINFMHNLLTRAVMRMANLGFEEFQGFVLSLNPTFWNLHSVTDEKLRVFCEEGGWNKVSSFDRKFWLVTGPWGSQEPWPSCMMGLGSCALPILHGPSTLPMLQLDCKGEPQTRTLGIFPRWDGQSYCTSPPGIWQTPSVLLKRIFFQWKNLHFLSSCSRSLQWMILPKQI